MNAHKHSQAKVWFKRSQMTVNPNDLNKYLDVAKEALSVGVILKERFGKVCPSMIDEKAKNDFRYRSGQKVRGNYQKPYSVSIQQP